MTERLTTKLTNDLPDLATLTTDQLADVVIEGIKKFERYLPYVHALKTRFAEAPRDSNHRLKTPIKDCHTWAEFCTKCLDRTRQAIDKALRGPRVHIGLSDHDTDQGDDWIIGERDLLDGKLRESWPPARRDAASPVLTSFGEIPWSKDDLRRRIHFGRLDVLCDEGRFKQLDMELFHCRKETEKQRKEWEWLAYWIHQRKMMLAGWLCELNDWDLMKYFHTTHADSWGFCGPGDERRSRYDDF